MKKEVSVDQVMNFCKEHAITGPAMLDFGSAYETFLAEANPLAEIEFWMENAQNSSQNPVSPETIVAFYVLLGLEQPTE